MINNAIGYILSCCLMIIRLSMILGLVGLISKNCWLGFVYEIKRTEWSTSVCVKRSVPNNTCQGKCHLRKLAEQTQHNGSEKVSIVSATDEALFYEIPLLNKEQILLNFVSGIRRSYLTTQSTFSNYAPPPKSPPPEEYGIDCNEA